MNKICKLQCMKNVYKKKIHKHLRGEKPVICRVFLTFFNVSIKLKFRIDPGNNTLRGIYKIDSKMCLKTHTIFFRLT